jgi:hypothetical protein
MPWTNSALEFPIRLQADHCDQLAKTDDYGNVAICRGVQSGRTWDRTRDLPRVKRALSR